MRIAARLSFACVLLFCSLIPFEASADSFTASEVANQVTPLGAINFLAFGNGVPVSDFSSPPTAVQIGWGPCSVSPVSCPNEDTPSIFGGLSIPPSNNPQTYLVVEGGPAFQAVEDAVTEPFAGTFGFGSGMNTSEVTLLDSPFTSTVGTPSLVLPGADIEAFTITIQPFQLARLTFDGKSYYGTTTIPGSNTLDLVGVNVSVFGTPAPVPEPSSLLLIGTGLVALSGVMRRKLLC